MITVLKIWKNKRILGKGMGMKKKIVTDIYQQTQIENSGVLVACSSLFCALLFAREDTSIIYVWDLDYRYAKHDFFLSLG